MNERLWIEELNNKHVLFYDDIIENVCFSSIDYMSEVIKQNNPNATFKVYEIDDEYTFIVMF